METGLLFFFCLIYLFIIPLVINLYITDTSTCTVSVSIPPVFDSSKKPVSACTLYHDKGPEPWLRKASTDAWLSTGIGEAIDGSDNSPHDQGDIYCVVCYESGDLEIFDVPNFSSVFSVEKMSGKNNLIDTIMRKDSAEEGRKVNTQNMNVVELAMQRWSGQHSRPFLFAILSDGTILCYHAYLFEGQETASRIDSSGQNSVNLSSISASRLRNLRFVRVSLDTYAREENSTGNYYNKRITIFKNVGGHQGLFLSGSRPTWFMVFRERLRVHPQVSKRFFCAC